MYELGNPEVDTAYDVVVDTDWAFTDKSRTRFVRADGYNGAATAELTITKDFYIGVSYRVHPRLTLMIPRDPEDLDDTTPDPFLHAAYLVERAEAGYADALKFVVQVPASHEVCPAGWSENRPSGHLRRLSRVLGGRFVTLMETEGGPGSRPFVIVDDSVLEAGEKGQVIVFADLEDAVDYVEENLMKREG